MIRVEFSTDRYEFDHGHKPRGRGYWAFVVEGETIFVQGEHTLAEAKKIIKAQLIDGVETARGEAQVYEVEVAS